MRQTWLRDVYDEMAPALSQLGLLVGRSMHAQGLIALCNATLMFVALTVLGSSFAAMLAPILLGNPPIYDSLRERTTRSGAADARAGSRTVPPALQKAKAAQESL